MCNCSKPLHQIVQQYEAGYIEAQHCDCEGCQAKRQNLKLNKCQDGSCGACKRIVKGEKIYSWKEDYTKISTNE